MVVVYRLGLCDFHIFSKKTSTLSNAPLLVSFSYNISTKYSRYRRIRSSSSQKRRMSHPGYYRVPSLVSVWSSAPFLHNNMLGKFTGDPFWQAGSTHLMMRSKNCSGRRSGRIRIPSGEPKRLLAAFAEGISDGAAETASSVRGS